MHPVNERWCYTVMPCLIGWARTQNDPCMVHKYIHTHMHTYTRVFQNLKYFSCIGAFHSPMMHAKRNSYAKFQQNRCGFGPPSLIFWFRPSGLEKHHIYYIYKYQKCPRPLQVWSFSVELTSEKKLCKRKNICSKIDFTLWKYKFIVMYFIGSWLCRVDEKCQYFTMCIFTMYGRI